MGYEMLDVVNGYYKFTVNKKGEYCDYGLTEAQVHEIDLKNKKVSVYKEKLKKAMEKFTNDQTAELFRMIFEYSETWDEPVTDDMLVDFAFASIKEGMDFDRTKYICEIISQSVKHGGTKYKLLSELPVLNTGQPRITTVKTCNQQITTDNITNPWATYRTDKDTDTDTDTDKDTDTDTGTEKDSKGKTIPSFDDACSYMNHIFPKYHVTGRDNNILKLMVQQEYEHGNRYSESDLEEMAKNSPSICQKYIDAHQRGTKAI